MSFVRRLFRPVWLRMLLLGAVSALALPPVFLLPVLLLTVPLLVRACGIAGTDPVGVRAATWRGFLFGLGLHTAGLYWVTDAVLVRAAEFWWFVPLAAPLLAIPLACFTAFSCGVARFACRWSLPGWRRALLFAGAWVLGDMLRGFLFTGFPWNMWCSVWEWPGRAGDVMIQPAAWISIHGLTLLTLLLAQAPLFGRRAIGAGIAGLLVWAGAGAARLHRLHPGADGPAVVLVQGNIPEAEKQNRGRALATFRTYLQLTHDGVADAVRRFPGAPLAFVWPETMFPGLLDEDAAARQVLMEAAPGAAAGLVGSVRYDGAGRPRNSLVALGPDGAVEALYDKAHLVPFGEYQPAILPIQVVPGGGFASGPGPRTLRLPGLPTVGPLICYEVIFPGRAVDPAARPAWIVNITNDAWYGDTAGPRQHLAAARMRAVEQGLPLARAANTGISAAFDAFGHQLAWLGWGVAGTVDVRLPGPLQPTLFSRYGLLIPLLLAVACCLAGILPPMRGRNALIVSKTTTM